MTVHEGSEADVLGIHFGLLTGSKKELSNEDNQTVKNAEGNKGESE